MAYDSKITTLGIGTVRGKTLFDPLLILYVCPLTKKWSVYNFNGRFILTVRDNNNKKIQKNAFQKSYKLVCILMSEISIWPLRKTWLSTWWQNPCWQSQRSDRWRALSPPFDRSGCCPHTHWKDKCKRASDRNVIRSACPAPEVVKDALWSDLSVM